MNKQPFRILDISFNVLKSYSIYNDDVSKRLAINNVDPKIIGRAWQKLVTDGFAYVEETQTSANNTSIRYYITFHGLQALADCPYPFRGKPYEWQRKKLFLKRIWKLVSLLAIIANAIIVLVFTYLTYLKD